MKTDLFQSCDPCWVFQICWHIECSTFTALSFRIWNSSTGIPSPPLASFIVMLPQAHLTSHSRMPGSRSVITPSWLSRSWRSFLDSSPMYSCHLFLISTSYVRSIPFLSFIVPIFAWNVPLVSLIFLNRSLVFPILLFSSFSLHFLRVGWRILRLLLFLLDPLQPSSGTQNMYCAQTKGWVTSKRNSICFINSGIPYCLTFGTEFFDFFMLVSSFKT